MPALLSFVGVVRKSVRSDYCIDFPDLPGCITAGRNMPEARRLAAAAVARHLEGMAADGASIPTPRSLATIGNDRRYADAMTLILVPAPTNFPLKDE